MRFAKNTALIACLAAAFLGGCGSSGSDKGKQIPAATRVELDKQLKSIEGRFDFGRGACSDIAMNKASVQKTLDALPSDVDSDVKNALSDGFDRLFQLTDEQCDANKGQQTETQTTPTEPAPTPTETHTEPTPTTPTDTTQTGTTPQEQPKTPKKDKGTKGNGGGGSAPQSGGGGGVVAPGGSP